MDPKRRVIVNRAANNGPISPVEDATSTDAGGVAADGAVGNGQGPERGDDTTTVTAGIWRTGRTPSIIVIYRAVNDCHVAA